MPETRITATFRGICAKCGDWIEVGQDIEPSPPWGWGHVVCPEEEEPQFDDRPRCRYCGDLLTPDFECESCPGA